MPLPQIISEVYLQSHERGRRHQDAVSRLPESHAPPIITLEEDREEGESGAKVMLEQVRAGRKRARKLRQRMAARSAETVVCMECLTFRYSQGGENKSPSGMRPLLCTLTSSQGQCWCMDVVSFLNMCCM